MVVFELFSDMKCIKTKLLKANFIQVTRKKEINTEYKMNEADIMTSERSGTKVKEMEK